MLNGGEIRARVREGLSNGWLWRLAQDRAKLYGATGGEDSACHVCRERIALGQAFQLTRTSAVVLAHHRVRRLPSPDPERAAVGGAPHHARCRDHLDDAASTGDLTMPRGSGERR